MRIALLHPTYWPEVRRGSERLAHDLGAALVRRGHEVTLLTSHDAPTARAVEDGMRVIRDRRPPSPPGAHLYEDHLATAPAAIWRLARGDFDVAHALYPLSGWAASRARRLGGPPFVLSIHGILRRQYLVERRYRLEMLKDAIAAAAVTSVLSDAAAEPFRRYALGDPIVLPGGVVSAEYAGERSPAEAPTLLCAASLDDPRKRGALLIRAFGRVRADLPDARLVLAGGGDPGALTGDDGLPDGVEVLNVDRTVALARAYRSAWATVLPSIHEAFGLVLLESLAAGTPVVAARSGAAPEVVSANGGTSRLFDPDDEAGLARAMREALELPRGAETVTACREQAARYEWDRVVEDYESAYATAAGVPA